MKTLRQHGSEGFVLLELLVVLSIVSALSSIAIPRYVTYRERAKAAACSANRRNIKMKEISYFSDHGAPNLNIDGRYSCPSGGIYFWVVSDSDDPDYPQPGCSIHFAGSAATPAQTPGTTTTTTSTTTTSTTSTATSPTTTIPPDSDDNPVQQIERLIDDVLSLNLDKGISNQLISKLNNAKKKLNDGKMKQAISNMNSFIQDVDKQKGKKIDETDADELMIQADEIIGMIE